MNRPKSWIALTTDFGDSHYVGQLKGVLAWLAPESQIIDLTHAVQPQNILAGAIVLQDSFLQFPPETIHIAVVDPGVGTSRAIVAMRLLDRWVIGPDNGLLSGLLSLGTPTCILRVTNSALWRQNVSQTFHGRDIMAPVAAHLANGGLPHLIGEPIDQLEVTIIPKIKIMKLEGDSFILEGMTLLEDHYGNLLSNIQASDLAQWLGHGARDTVERRFANDELSLQIHILEHFKTDALSDDGIRGEEPPLHRRAVARLVRTYGEAEPGELVGLIGSSGRLEISAVNGSAAKLLGGTRFLLRLVRQKGDGLDGRLN